MRRAVIDVGSNSVLLAVAEKREDGWHELLSTSAVTGLGRGTKETGVLSDESMSDTLAAMESAFRAAREMGAPCRAAGTMALRMATNADEFLVKAQAQGTPLTVLSADDEARLGLLAVSGDPAFVDRGQLAVIDTGGHSTEIALTDSAFRHSYGVGALGLKGSVLSAECPSPADVFRASHQIDELLGGTPIPDGERTAVAVGATPTNLVSIDLGLAEWSPGDVHGEWLDYEQVSKAVGWLSAMPELERRSIPGIEPGREATLHIGALILERCLYALKLEGCLVSVKGWRHAMLDMPLWD